MQLVAQQCCVASWDGLLRVLPPSWATNFHVAKSKSHVYFWQHKNLLRDNTRNKPPQLATEHCYATSCTKNVWADLHGTIFVACDKLTTGLRHDLSPGQTDSQVVASSHKLNLRRDLRWVAKRTRKYTQVAIKKHFFFSLIGQPTCVDLGWVGKRWKTCVDLRENLISTKVSASHRKSMQVHARPGQTESQVDASCELASTRESVWPGLYDCRIILKHVLKCYDIFFWRTQQS